jgi:hypothetical protein
MRVVLRASNWVGVEIGEIEECSGWAKLMWECGLASSYRTSCSRRGAFR